MSYLGKKLHYKLQKVDLAKFPWLVGVHRQEQDRVAVTRGKPRAGFSPAPGSLQPGPEQGRPSELCVLIRKVDCAYAAQEL